MNDCKPALETDTVSPTGEDQSDATDNPTGNTVFVICNQLEQYWTRSGEWVDGRDPQRLLKLKHRDEAVNQLVELSAKAIDLRGVVLACDLNGRGEPDCVPSKHRTPTLAERAAQAKEAKRQIAAQEAGQQLTDEVSGDAAIDTPRQEPAVPADV
ncbi:MAG: hypothetical protein ACI87W_000165 [Halieaceae bacterium]